jgi:hypothetical protein
VDQVVGQWNADEQQQWRLDDRGEKPGPAHCQDRGHATQGVEDGEDAAEFLVSGTRFDRDPKQRRSQRDQDRTPPRNTHGGGESGALFGSDSTLIWHP